MGIQGLLPLLEGITKSVHISEFSGKKVAIDVYCWLHKGVYGCSMELCNGKPTDKYVQYCMKRLHLLLQFNVIPIVIFDGGSLPIKKEKELERRKSREEYRAKGNAYLREGNSQAANECFQKAVDITPSMAYSLIRALRRENVEYIVAPYEADAQLAFLALNNFVDCIITEDSDMLAYGCPKVLFKMDKDGYGKQVKLSDLPSLQTVSFLNFTQEMLRQVCILAGCDYLVSITGLGIKTAHRLMKKYRSIDRIFSFLKANKSNNFPSNYEENFKKAELTFQYQRVFDPSKNSLVTLNPLSNNIEDNSLDFLGPQLTNEIAIQIAVGNMDPHSKQLFTQYEYTIISQKETNSETSSSELNTSSNNPSLRNSNSLILPVQKNSITNYFSVSSTSATKKPFVPPRSKLSLSANDTKLYDQKEEIEEVVQAPVKRQKITDDVVLAPQSPPKKLVVSKYFVSSGKRLSKSLFADKVIDSDIPSFSSPLINNSGRLSLCSVSCSNVNTLERLTDHETLSDDEDPAILSETDIIKSDDEEIIKSDPEDEITAVSVFN